MSAMMESMECNRNWDGVSMQDALLQAEVVWVTQHEYYLKLGDKIIPVGCDKDFAELLCFAIRRNARAWHEVRRAKV